MHIVCPNCTTAYAVNPATFGDAGRTVRCARCKEVWLAQPEDLARREALVPAAAAAPPPPPDDDMNAWGLTDDDSADQDQPLVESPSIASALPAEEPPENPAWAEEAQDEPALAPADAKTSRLSAALSRLRGLAPSMPARIPFLPRINSSIACAGMAALVLALMIWRVDVVKLMPQTASFYKAVGLGVNLRGLSFKDVKVATEEVDGKRVLVIEGNIVGDSHTKPVAMPRLRFVVRDEHGTEIYAWTAVLDQQGLNPGDKAWFKSRLASPPAEGRTIDVRFFNKRDIGA
ncbi:MJ0042-type zinc finger domain-containing protein [Rhodopseudomonas sp. P2A-2r]|uniref:MJ0042-type zinc finger domain-containing protein n=1 Tax=unclassified Rhodopseudomonas TaxID=2638247 RepID=UPI0022346DA6|nr:MJ0042-type zinc finger domain-containing protein [Rhodopseudomonas sp. P2A-2r]UZE50212.1 zinc-ribbon domain-containing protein [Rhodopseudomonas sp. P2A-2r]